MAEFQTLPPSQKHAYSVSIEDLHLGKDRVVQSHIVKDHAIGPDDVICISFDIETTGQYMHRNGMPELGAVAFVDNNGEMREIGTFEGHLALPEGCGFERSCEVEFWDVHKVEEKKLVQACTLAPEVAMTAFVEWVEQIRFLCLPSDPNPQRRIRFVTDAAYFDAGWVSYYLCRFANHATLHQFFGGFMPLIDTNAFNRGVAGVTLEDELEEFRGPKGWFSSDGAARKKLGLEDKSPPTAHDHRAVNDAHAIGWKYHRVTTALKLKRKAEGQLGADLEGDQPEAKLQRSVSDSH